MKENRCEIGKNSLCDEFFKNTSHMYFLLATYDLEELGLRKRELPTFSLQIHLRHDSI